MNRDELNKILESHLHWLREDVEGWEDMRANLRYTNLRYTNLSYADLNGANLSDANLSNADLSNADLKGANLSNANLRGANLRGANLINANLRYADLSNANLSDADLINADLSNADLINADLSNANLSDANLSDANLINANLSYANLSGADLSGAKGALIEFRKGKTLTEDIIGYKKCRDDVIIKLLIPRGAIVFSINGSKCRTNKAKVLEIEGADRAISNYKYMSYYAGDEFTVYDFNCEYNVECAPGIHFFMTKEEAVRY